MTVSDARRLKELEAENGKLKKLLAPTGVGQGGPEGSPRPKMVGPQVKGRTLLDSLTAGNAPDDPILRKEDGTTWRKDDQWERIRETCIAANISPPVNFHALRHTTASLLIEKGVPLAFVAEMLGHSDTRMVSKHYAHLAPNIVHEEIRAKLPSFNVRIDEMVKKIRP